MHEPVLLAATVDLLAVRPGGTYVDGTVGGGGHAVAVASLLDADGLLVCIDRDADALERARRRLRGARPRVVFAQGSFADMAAIAARAGARRADGVLLDLGVSSEQIDTPERGFSFRLDGPLDMRMDRGGGPTAADLVNELSDRELARIIADFGEERAARRVARAIVAERSRGPITRTAQLAAIVARAVGRGGRIHPATRTFQALRIAVNGELDALQRGLRAGIGLLAPDGRMAVISFHSLEDRAVKIFFRAHAGREEAQPAGGVRWAGETPRVRLLTRRAVRPAPGEMENNPRCRSARLRAVERVADPAETGAAAGRMP